MPRNESAAQEMLSQVFSNVDSKSHEMGFDSLITSSSRAYQKAFGKPLDAGRKAVLQSSLTNYSEKLIQSGKATRESIMSATADLSKLDSPITLMFNLMSILIPNFAYQEVVGIQPMPTKKSPIIFPEIIANDTRNGVTTGDKLLGATRWNTNNYYSTNRSEVTGTLATSTSQTITLTKPASTGDIQKGTVNAFVTISGTVYNVYDDAAGTVHVDGVVITAGSVDYAAGTLSLTLAAAAAATDTYSVNFRYDFGTANPAQITLQFTDEVLEAFPHRLRSTYDLDNFYQAKKLLKDFDMGAILSSDLAGYINKEISCGVFDDILAAADANDNWTSTAANVAWALHRLSVLNTLQISSNTIRQNVARSRGNKLIAGTKFASLIETLGDDVWKPASVTDEPIGPYVSGKLLGYIDVIKNQDYPEDKAVLTYKKSDIDAAFMGGVFIALYSTEPLAMDTLNVIQGMGTQFAYKKVFDNTVRSLTYV